MIPVIRRCALTCSLLILALPGLAQEPTHGFAPPDPEPNGREWVRMSSGEWLMGDLKNLRDDDFVFDSEDLNELTLDWDDVVELRSPRVLTYVFEDKVILVGTGLVRGSEVLIDDGTGKLAHRASRSRQDSAPGKGIFSSTMAETVLMERKAVLTRDARQDALCLAVLGVRPDDAAAVIPDPAARHQQLDVFLSVEMNRRMNVVGDDAKRGDQGEMLGDDFHGRPAGHEHRLA